MRGYGDVGTASRPGPPASALVIEKHIVPIREVEHLREKVVVVRTWPAVEDYETVSFRRTVRGPVEGVGGGSGKAGFARCGDCGTHRMPKLPQLGDGDKRHPASDDRQSDDRQSDDRRLNADARCPRSVSPFVRMSVVGRRSSVVGRRRPVSSCSSTASPAESHCQRHTYRPSQHDNLHSVPRLV